LRGICGPQAAGLNAYCIKLCENVQVRYDLMLAKQGLQLMLLSVLLHLLSAACPTAAATSI
jgi:hypothetical protein